MLLLHGSVAVAKLAILSGQTLSLLLDDFQFPLLGLVFLFQLALGTGTDTLVAFSAKLLDSLLKLQNVQDQDVRAVKNEREEEGEAAKVPLLHLN